MIFTRLWHYRLIPVLPKEMLVSQWRECIAIKRQWEKGTLKHRLVSYVEEYPKSYLYNYTKLILDEMHKRKFKVNEDLIYEMLRFGCGECIDIRLMYNEHSDRYLRQCISNLEEKFDRGIISREEWVKIIDYYKEILEGKR